MDVLLAVEIGPVAAVLKSTLGKKKTATRLVEVFVYWVESARVLTVALIASGSGAWLL
jgi:hypothetical protein